MSFPRYPTYKPSGVEWLGEVPEHWNVDRMKWAIEQPKNGIWGNEESGDENDIPCVRVADFDRQGMRVFLDNPTIRNVTRKEREGRVLVKNDLLIEKSGGGELQPVGCVVIYEDDRPAISSNFVAKASARIGMSASYWRYLHSAAYAARINTRSIKQTSGIQNLDQSQYLDESSCYPPLREQERIATFLDHETAKIDALIAEQQRLIELLQEKRQAVISHAVTKGLNPHAPMKDSGVEWLGEVPEHWEVKRLKDIAYVIDCRNKTPEYDEAGDYLVARTSNIKRQSLSLDEALYTDRRNFEIWTQRGIPQPGSILFTREAPTGEVCLVPEGIPLCMGQRMMNFACHDDGFTGFLMIYLQSDCLTRYIESTSHGSTVSHLRVSQVENIPVIVPARAEVLAIASHVDQLTAAFNNLMDEASRSISLIQERRSALISAAVTGHIDVRGLVPVAGAA